MDNLFKIPNQELNHIFEQFAKKDEVLWIRTPSYDQQIFLSASYESVWGRKCETLYTHPLSWKETLTSEYKDNFVQMQKERFPSTSGQLIHNDIFLYQMLDVKQQLCCVKDVVCYLFDKMGRQVAVVGIANKITPIEWELANSTAGNPLDHLDKSYTDCFKAIASIFKLAINNKPFLLPSKACDQNYLLRLGDGREIAVTKRQAECIYYLSEGGTAKKIARALDLSPRTIEKYLESLKNKTNTHNNITLVANIVDMCPDKCNP